jgi:hypothetical protein
VRRRAPSAAALASTATIVVALLAAPRSASAQEPPRPRPEWGFTIGLEALTSLYEPRLSTPYAYSTRGYGMALNVGSVFKGHILVGADVGWAMFGGDRRFPADAATAGYAVRTTNSILGSLYTGLISSAIGRSNEMGRKFWVGARLGNGRWSGERRLEACANCNYEPLPMRSSYYIQPFVVFGGGDRSGGGGFRLSYTHYMRANSTIRSAVAFGFYFNLLALD